MNLSDEPDTCLLFICTGNICRSPLGAGLFTAFASKHRSHKLLADSAGINALLGAAAEPYVRELAVALGADITGHQARQFTSADFAKFDFVIALDPGHDDFIKATQPKDSKPQTANLRSLRALQLAKKCRTLTVGAEGTSGVLQN